MQQDAYDRMAHESARMNADVAALLAAREAEALRHAEAVHETKREMLELRQSLEHTFRKTLADAEQAHQARAFGALGAGAKDALLTNAKLKEELSLQAIGMKNLDPSVAQEEDQRSCASFDEALDKLAIVQQALPRVTAEPRVERRVDDRAVAHLRVAVVDVPLLPTFREPEE